MHLDEGTIHAWLDGALDAEEAARVERHAAECRTCAADVAEARGLVAGASRILTALDVVPAGVVPKAGAAGGATRAKRTRSLWATLHLTPARAAAAAVVVLAAGTALVLRNTPNAARPAIKLADYPRDSAVTFRPAAPLATSSVPDTAQVLAAPERAASSPSRIVLKAAAPQPTPASSRRAVIGRSAAERVGSVAAAKKAEPARAADVAVVDSLRRERNADSIATPKESALARSAVADNASRGAVAGAASRAPAAPPPSATAQRFSEAKVLADPRSIAGCYIVTADSAVSLPPRLWLDSALSMGRRGVSEMVNDAQRSIPGAYWAPLGDGSIRLSLPALAQNADLRPATVSTFVGAVVVGGRSATVTLRRAECGRQ